MKIEEKIKAKYLYKDDLNFSKFYIFFFNS